MAKNHSTGYILTPAPVRLSFVHARTGEVHKRTGKIKYGCTLLVPKTPGKTLKDDPSLAAYRGLVAEVLKVHRPNGPIPLKLGIRDGDVPNGNGNIPSGYAGNWVIAAGSNNPIDIYTDNAQKTMDEKLVRGGNWAIAQINAFWFDVDNSQGVSFGLAALQFHHEDSALGGGAPAPAFAPVPG